MMMMMMITTTTTTTAIYPEFNAGCWRFACCCSMAAAGDSCFVLVWRASNYSLCGGCPSGAFLRRLFLRLYWCSFYVVGNMNFPQKAYKCGRPRTRRRQGWVIRSRSRTTTIFLHLAKVSFPSRNEFLCLFRFVWRLICERHVTFTLEDAQIQMFCSTLCPTLRKSENNFPPRDRKLHSPLIENYV